MPDVKKYVSDLDLQYYHGRINTLFAKQADLDTLEAEVQEIISEGGEPNVIETVKVNGTALTPDAQKAVDVTVPTKTSDLTNDGDGTSNFATEAYVGQNGGKIDTISVNGTQQTITNKNVDITVPTVGTSENPNGYATWDDVFTETGDLDGRITVIEGKIPSTASEQNQLVTYNDYISDLASRHYQNASDVSTAITTALANGNDPYQTESDVDGKISTAITSVYKYKGSVATYNDLPSSGQTTGDVWDVQADGMNYAWTGSSWDALGQYVDTSTLWGKSELVAMTTAEIDALFETA